jgi:hypothetical protein
MPTTTITLSSATSSSPGASAAVALNWRVGQPATVSIFSTNSGSSCFFQIEFSLDDIQLVRGASLAQWQSLSSAYNDTTITSGAGSVFATSAITTNGMLFSFDGPMGAVRVNSSAMTSGPLTLKVIQADGSGG